MISLTVEGLVVLNWYDLFWRSDKNMMTQPLSLLCWEYCVPPFSSGLWLYWWDYEWCCVKVSCLSVFLSKCAFCNTLRLLRKRHHKLLFYCHKARCVYGRVYLHLCSHSFISSLLKIKCKCYWIKEQTAAAGLYGRVNECVRMLIVAQIWFFAGLMFDVVSSEAMCV